MPLYPGTVSSLNRYRETYEISVHHIQGDNASWSMSSEGLIGVHVILQITNAVHHMRGTCNPGNYQCSALHEGE